MISSGDILTVLDTSPPSDSNDLVHNLRIQYELVLAFIAVQSQTDVKARDAEWPQILSSGKLTNVIERLFVHSGRGQSEEARDVEMMKQVLLSFTQGAQD